MSNNSQYVFVIYVLFICFSASGKNKNIFLLLKFLYEFPKAKQNICVYFAQLIEIVENIIVCN